MPGLTAIAMLLAQKAGATTAIFALASLIRLLDRSEISLLPKGTSMVVLVDPEAIAECLSAPEGD
jgi:hypothetical protein